MAVAVHSVGTEWFPVVLLQEIKLTGFLKLCSISVYSRTYLFFFLVAILWRIKILINFELSFIGSIYSTEDTKWYKKAELLQR